MSIAILLTSTLVAIHMNFWLAMLRVRGRFVCNQMAEQQAS